MWKLIGHGKNWKKKRTVKSLLKISKFKKKLVNRSLPKRTNSLLSSLSSWSKKMKSTLKLSKSRMMISMTWLRLWANNSLIWESITTSNLIRLRKLSSEKEMISSNVMRMKSKNFSSNTRNLKRNAWTREVKIMSIIPLSWKNLRLKMPTIKLNRRLSLKKKCKFSRNAWRTWKLYTDSMKKSLNSTTECSRKEKRSTNKLWIISRRGKESTEKFWELSKENSSLNTRVSPTITKSWPRTIKSSPRNSYSFKRNMNVSKRVTRIDSMRFGLWTKTKLALFVRKSRIVIRWFMFNNWESLGSLLPILSSNNKMEQVPQVLVKQVDKV